MAALVFAAVVLLSAAAAQASTIQIGGASSVQPIVQKATDLAASVPGLGQGSIGDYLSVGSGAGQTAFINRVYEVAYSDVAFDANDDSAAGGTSKYTIPFAVATYSFCTLKKGSSTLRFTGSQLYNIYTSDAYIPWSTYVSKATGNVLPVARSDGSGTTEVIGKWLKTQVSAWPFTTTDSWSGQSGVSAKITYVLKSGGMIAALKGDSNRIGYLQSGLCTLNGVPVVAVNNAAGAFVSTNLATDLSALMPNPIPAYNSAVWSGVSLLNKPGPTTYPIGSIIYMFARKSYNNPAISSIVQAWVKFTMTATVQNLMKPAGVAPLPQKYRDAGIAAGKTISG